MNTRVLHQANTAASRVCLDRRTRSDGNAQSECACVRHPTPGESKMSDVKKDHSIGSGTGAIGAKAGDSIAEAVNPTEYTNYFETNYKSVPYYQSGRDWSDYQPAYQYGYDTYGQYRGQKFEDVESSLERDWDSSRARSRLAWNEARDAVRDGWHHIERAMPGDADRDGR
jgi:hypothetical protein